MQEASVEIRKLISFWDHTISENKDCYIGETPEETRVMQWPNNPKLKESNPSHYFEIYEDCFYRHTHRFITPSTPIGSVGSCFAKRIAHQLQAWGYNYVIEEDDLPPDFPIENLHLTHYRMAPARVGTLLNAGSIRQMMERAFGGWEPDMLILENGGRFRDPFRYIETLYDSIDKYYEDYQNHTKALQRALMKCEVFIITLGLTEAWQFTHSGDYISLDPRKIDPLLVKQKNMTVGDNINELERILFLYKKRYLTSGSF